MAQNPDNDIGDSRPITQTPTICMPHSYLKHATALTASASAFRLLKASAIVVAFSCAANGQEMRSVLEGPIQDPQGQPIINAVTSNTADAAQVARIAPSEEIKNVPVDAGEKVDALITKMVLENIPHEFKEDKDWGGQEARWNGVDVRRDGLKLRTHRKKKMFNHGTWKRYEVSLLNPKEQFAISVKNMREAEDGKMAFDVHVSANLKIDGRQAKWVRGVQLFNVSVDGKSKVNLVATIELRTLMDITKFPPDLVFRPEAKSVDISLSDFRIDRISKVGGEVAQQVTRIAERSLEQRMEKEEVKTVKKLNAEFEKNADKLKLSLQDAMSTKWSAAAKKFMPADVKQALEN